MPEIISQKNTLIWIINLLSKLNQSKNTYKGQKMDLAVNNLSKNENWDKLESKFG